MKKSFKWENEDLLLQVYIQANAKQNKIIGMYNDCLKISITTPAIDGKANAALIKFLAQELNVSKSKIIIEKGKTSKTKTIRIINIQKIPNSLKTTLKI